ncbi:MULTISPECIES: TetR/AcrR family transcriptional regulator C-terminal domain-containing protein [Actinomadura]|uniref:TetR family transcriptional regulator n=1 Tax=Actinomadura litoris TaxID=2678616 RepID=A0A7K1KZQ0_9ACTN|nr:MULTISPECIES: TetR/AcrR family transcriptional regulator C-terminal domain-containing protein [Actinomadura]MBT2212061.1 TetR/AcrR family transcriptional regulator C-terminal domain-containing protein [Actinomadura sp. NEAU-AAG7]MUN37446.1 TetR family transcriptional regulator [Actinomadura litoris]
MVVFAGQGDARRTMDLLWRPDAGSGPPRPGPRPGLSVDVIVAAAIAAADAEGMAALSMRAVGERLGRTAMALYTYVPGKSELVDLMYDRALAELPDAYDISAGWRPAVMAWAEDSWAFYLRHPWMLQVSQARPVLGPNEYRALETLLGVLSGTGLGARDTRRAVAALSQVVRGSAQTLTESRQVVGASGTSEADWWYARTDVLVEVAPDFAHRYPALARLEAESPPYTPDGELATYLELASREAFEGGLALVLDGIETTIARTA